MDTGSKSLAQLSEEGKEKKYVTVEIGSKVSGYTKDYLERLCRLRKVEYLLRPDGGFALELESLLNETHTILLSYEGVTFMEKSSLIEPPVAEKKELFQSDALKEVVDLSVSTPLADEPVVTEEQSVDAPVQVHAQPIPRFGDVNHLNQQAYGGNPFSFVGRPIISDGSNVEPIEEKEIHIPIGGGEREAPATPNAIHHSIPVSLADRTEKAPVAPVAPPAPEPVHHEPTHLKIVVDQKTPMNAASAKTVSPSTTVPHPSVPVKLSVKSGADGEQKTDDWDNLLFGAHAQPVDHTPPLPIKDKMPLPQIPIAPPSVFHPIQTSVDASAHHDDGPLFPTIDKAGVPPPVRAASTGVASPFVPPTGQRVVVFDPGIRESVLSGETKSIIPPAPIIPRAVPLPASEQKSEPAAAPALSPEKADAPAPTVPSAVGTPAPQMMTPRTPLPLMRVMPQSAMMQPEEHRLMMPEAHSLMAASGMHVISALFVGTGLLLLLGGLGLERLGVDLNSTSYVAAVGSVSEPVPPRADPPPQREVVLPFSNELVVATNTPKGTLEVTPVFEHASGTTYRFEIDSFPPR
jgi:hypothetical protein